MEYEVQEILGSRWSVQNRLLYLIHWAGYPRCAATWEPAENLNCPDLLREFREKNRAEDRWDENGEAIMRAWGFRIK
jgi:chromobox protein 1/chromobox protein 5